MIVIDFRFDTAEPEVRLYGELTRSLYIDGFVSSRSLLHFIDIDSIRACLSKGKSKAI